jgi:hypothetical protein
VGDIRGDNNNKCYLINSKDGTVINIKHEYKILKKKRKGKQTRTHMHVSEYEICYWWLVCASEGDDTGHTLDHFKRAGGGSNTVASSSARFLSKPSIIRQPAVRRRRNENVNLTCSTCGSAGFSRLLHGGNLKSVAESVSTDNPLQYVYTCCCQLIVEACAAHRQVRWTCG